MIHTFWGRRAWGMGGGGREDMGRKQCGFMGQHRCL